MSLDIVSVGRTSQQATDAAEYLASVVGETPVRMLMVEISGDLYAVPAFADAVAAEAKRRDVVVVYFNGAYFTDGHTKQRVDVDVRSAADFSALPMLVRIFVGGIEAQLRSVAVYVGSHEAWTYVPGERDLRFPALDLPEVGSPEYEAAVRAVMARKNRAPDKE